MFMFTSFSGWLLFDWRQLLVLALNDFDSVGSTLALAVAYLSFPEITSFPSPPHSGPFL